MSKFIILAALSLFSLSAFSQSTLTEKLECNIEVDTYQKKKSYSRSRSKPYSHISEDNSGDLILYYEEEREIYSEVGSDITVKISTNGNPESAFAIDIYTQGQQGVDKYLGSRHAEVIAKDNKFSKIFSLSKISTFDKDSKNYYKIAVRVNCKLL